LLIDVQGFKPGFLRSATSTVDAIAVSTNSGADEVGETWLLRAKKIDGGAAIVGMREGSQLRDPNQVLATAPRSFGNTLTEG